MDWSNPPTWDEETIPVVVTFDCEEARNDFEREWIKRTGGSPVDHIESGVQYAGANAERALDIAAEIAGVTVKSL